MCQFNSAVFIVSLLLTITGLFLIGVFLFLLSAQGSLFEKLRLWFHAAKLVIMLSITVQIALYGWSASCFAPGSAPFDVMYVLDLVCKLVMINTYILFIVKRSVGVLSDTLSYIMKYLVPGTLFVSTAGYIVIGCLYVLRYDQGLIVPSIKVIIAVFFLAVDLLLSKEFADYVIATKTLFKRSGEYGTNKLEIISRHGLISLVFALGAMITSSINGFVFEKISAQTTRLLYNIFILLISTTIVHLKYELYVCGHIFDDKKTPPQKSGVTGMLPTSTTNSSFPKSTSIATNLSQTSAIRSEQFV